MGAKANCICCKRVGWPWRTRLGARSPGGPARRAALSHKSWRPPPAGARRALPNPGSFPAAGGWHPHTQCETRPCCRWPPIQCGGRAFQNCDGKRDKRRALLVRAGCRFSTRECGCRDCYAEPCELTGPPPGPAGGAARRTAAGSPAGRGPPAAAPWLTPRTSAHVRAYAAPSLQCSARPRAAHCTRRAPRSAPGSGGPPLEERERGGG